MTANRHFGVVAGLAANQYGVFTRTQAADNGIDRNRIRRLLDQGLIEAAGPGVLVVAGAPDSWERRLTVLTLHPCGPVASHRAAGELHALDGVDGRHVEVLIRRNQKLRVPGVEVHRTLRWNPDDIVTVRGIRCTSLARTLCDLGAVTSDDAVERATDHGLRRGASRVLIDRRLDDLRRPGPSGTGSLDRVLASPDRLGTLPENWFERSVVRAVVAAGFPPPVLQHKVPYGNGRSYRLDGAYPELRIGIEADGDGPHGSSTSRRNDRLRTNRLRALGWELVHAGWEDRHGSPALLAALREVYDRRSGRSSA